jgi:hypothetical protein
MTRGIKRNKSEKQLMKKLKSSRWFALVIVLTAPFLSLMDIFIINIAIPAIKKGLHSSDAGTGLGLSF